MSSTSKETVHALFSDITETQDMPSRKKTSPAGFEPTLTNERPWKPSSGDDE
ncbi:hypothetical protein POX_e06998 [Penicillium oxalicum]|uniref:hypothetical protein n=1 Tax=Penicillium oxalicum TaxID=69781 RepID=UPI0020B75675|nr:hypothetical protein POX_e06998 [Penicillium oxalicum]KAI2788973.1 hypothetical protein POX_e06998 [Penicillium oxalicum]